MSERFTATTHQCHLTASNCHRQFRKGRVIIAKRWTSFEGQVEKAVRATLAEMVGHGRQSAIAKSRKLRNPAGAIRSFEQAETRQKSRSYDDLGPDSFYPEW